MLDNINLTVREDEFVCLLRHSGCDKSTLLEIVAGLERSSSRLVTLEGKEVRKPECDRLMVFQPYALLPWLTVQDNVRLAVAEVLKGLSETETAQMVSEHLAMVNLTIWQW